MAETDEIKLKEAEILRLQPGDVVVLKVPHKLSAEQRECLRAQWERAWTGSAIVPDRVLILEDMDLDVVRADANTR